MTGPKIGKDNRTRIKAASRAYKVEILKPELNKTIKELKDSGVIEKIRILQGQRKGLEISIYGKPLRHDSPSTGLPPPHRHRHEEKIPSR